MRSQLVVLHELFHEVAHRQPEPSFEVRDEDDVLAVLRPRLNLVTGEPTFDSVRDPTGALELGYLVTGDVGALPISLGRG